MDFILAFVPCWAGGMWSNGLLPVDLDLLVHPQVWVAEMFSVFWKKRLEEEWERAAGGEKGNGMESPFRRRKTELCVKSLCQSLPGSSQCYHSRAALGQGADNPPRELRGGSSTAGLGRGTAAAHMGLCQAWRCTFRGTQGESLGSAQIVEIGRIGRKIGRSPQGGLLWLWMFKKSVSFFPGPLFAALSACTDLAAPGGACLASRGRGESHLRVSLCGIEVCCSTGRLMNETCTGKLRWSCIISITLLSDCSVCS